MLKTTQEVRDSTRPCSPQLANLCPPFLASPTSDRRPYQLPAAGVNLQNGRQMRANSTLSPTAAFQGSNLTNIMFYFDNLFHCWAAVNNWDYRRSVIADSVVLLAETTQQCQFGWRRRASVFAGIFYLSRRGWASALRFVTFEVKCLKI